MAVCNVGQHSQSLFFFFLLHILYFKFPQMRYLWNFSIEKRNEMRVSRCSRKLFEKEVFFIIPFVPFSLLCN